MNLAETKNAYKKKQLYKLLKVRFSANISYLT